MRAQVFNDYFKKQDEGSVPIIKCGNDADHGRPFVRLLDNDTDIELFCLACDWTLQPGLKYYETIVHILALHDVTYLKELNSE